MSEAREAVARDWGMSEATGLRRLFRPSLRLKLVLASVVVEAIMLSLLVGNSVRLIERQLTIQAEARMEALEASFTVALVSPLAERDYGTLQGLLEGLQRLRDVTYLVVTDASGKVVAHAGLPARAVLPPPDEVLTTDDPVFDARGTISLYGQDFGELRYGLSTEFLREARATLVRQSMAIALAEIVISVLALAVVGFLLTRHLEALTAASVRVARGDYSLNLRVSSGDEVGVLAASFSRMAQAVRDRIASLHRSSRLLRRSNADLARLAAVSAHNLQEPLRGIVSYSQILERRYADKLDPDGREFLRIVVHEGQHMKGLLQDLQAYVEAATAEPVAQPTDAEASLAVALSRLEIQLDAIGGHVRQGDLPSVCADHALLVQVFTRLIENSIAYRHPDRPLRVEVHAYADGGSWVLVVQDNGIGIPEDSLTRVFDLYERAVGSDCSVRSSGIGLAVCRRLIEVVGGSIWAAHCDEGANIRIRLASAENCVAQPEMD